MILIVVSKQISSYEFIHGTISTHGNLKNSIFVIMDSTKNSKHLIVLSGPTAVGKTSLSIQLAKSYNCPIISADSRQIYKLLNIGTAKPSVEERAGVIHYMMDIIEIETIYSAGNYERDVIKMLDELYQVHDVVILSGGTGLYIDAVTQGLDDFPDISIELHNSLNDIFKKEGMGILVEELKEKDPSYALEVDLSNSRRVIRALEVIRTSGQPFSSFLNSTKNKRNFNSHFIQIDRDRQELYKRINNRVDEMIKQGLVEEVKSLQEFESYSSLDTVGYREIFAYLKNDLALDEAIDEIKKHTRRYAKRQLTWFRRSDKWTKFHAENQSEIVDHLTSHINL